MRTHKKFRNGFKTNEKKPSMTRIHPCVAPPLPSPLRKMSPSAPSRRTNPAEEAATKAMRSEVRALLKLKRTPFEDKLMKLFTRDELVSLYRRSVGLQKDVPNDAVARQTKQWSKRTLAGKIHGLVKARTFGMVDGIVVAVAAIAGGFFGWRFTRGDGRNTGDDVGNGRGGGGGGSRGPAWMIDNDEHPQEMCPPAALGGSFGVRRSPSSDESDSTSSNLENERVAVDILRANPRSASRSAGERRGYGTLLGVSLARQRGRTRSSKENETSPNSVPRETQRILIATLCAVLAGGGWAGIAHGINVSARTRFRNRFAKQLRTLRAKRPSATSRRLTRFVKRFVGKK